MALSVSKEMMQRTG